MFKDRNNGVGGEGVRGRTDKQRSGETEEASPSDTLSCLAPGRRHSATCVRVCPRDELNTHVQTCTIRELSSFLCVCQGIKRVDPALYSSYTNK